MEDYSPLKHRAARVAVEGKFHFLAGGFGVYVKLGQMNCKARIEKILREEFQPLKLAVRDDSALHAGHAGAAQSGGSHFYIEIVSEKFKGIPSLKRHRMIYDCLYPQLKKEIHALSIKAGSP